MEKLHLKSFFQKHSNPKNLLEQEARNFIHNVFKIMLINHMYEKRLL